MLDLVGNPEDRFSHGVVYMYITGGAVELCDVGDQLTGLKYCKGIYTWKVSFEVMTIAALE